MLVTRHSQISWRIVHLFWQVDVRPVVDWQALALIGLTQRYVNTHTYMYVCVCICVYTYSMAQEPLKSFDRPLMRVSLFN